MTRHLCGWRYDRVDVMSLGRNYKVALIPYSSRVLGSILGSGYCLYGVLHVLYMSLWVSSTFSRFCMVPSPSVFLPCTQISWDKLWIHDHADQKKALPEDIWMNVGPVSSPLSSIGPSLFVDSMAIRVFSIWSQRLKSGLVSNLSDYTPSLCLITDITVKKSVVSGPIDSVVGPRGKA